MAVYTILYALALLFVVLAATGKGPLWPSVLCLLILELLHHPVA